MRSSLWCKAISKAKSLKLPKRLGDTDMAHTFIICLRHSSIPDSISPNPELDSSHDVCFTSNFILPCTPLLGFVIQNQKTHSFILKDVFSSVEQFFRFVIPSALMLCLEWWFYENLVLLSELLPDAKLETSVLSVCFASSALHYYVPFGISIAGSTRVSNELGAGNPQAAQVSTFVVMVVTLVETVLACIILFCFRYALEYAYNHEEEVVNKVAKMVPLMCPSLVMDGLHVVLAG
ncbi:MATE efflux family protein 6 [Hibiscus syriacus]|uniref:MATE efflux family protein 6 n=1 Tax=Hibiscus syriacus TaxID=106335 RepID=A0A6A3CNK5_HIBSY|nr:MATE efflux family protein 6 [Hibiscus syriacus]